MSEQWSAPAPASQYEEPTVHKRTWWSAVLLVALLAGALLAVFLPTTEQSRTVSINCGSAFAATGKSGADYASDYIADGYRKATAPGALYNPNDRADPSAAQDAGDACHSSGVTRVVVGGVLLMLAVGGGLFVNSWEVARARRRV